ncbi:uncharacterized protein LOC124156923 [Ischnura elegans]|uniref:uncharacterized protein LOC124156923 n=1 Tax=Ischnura elegans TaxID=197161 RepID=UPI001ED89BFC|nr:uncharacterized protein LOC124156923 [Ischnura elegans]
MIREVVWERRHMRLEEKINALTSMAETGNKLLVNLSSSEEAPSFIEKFPLSSIEEFEELEEQLQSNYSLYKALVKELARRSSEEDASFVYKLLYFLLKDSVAKEYSLTGKVGADGVMKKRFCDTKLHKAILDAGKKPALAHVGVDKINKKIGEWFRQTGTRMRRSLGRTE